MSFFRRLAVFIACSFGLLSSTNLWAAASGAPTMSIVSGDGQAVASNSGAPVSLTVMVRDSAANPIAGVKPTWTVVSGPGGVLNIPPLGEKCSVDVTDANGQNCHLFLATSVLFPQTFAQTVIKVTYLTSNVTFIITTYALLNDQSEINAIFTSPLASQLPLIGPAGTQGTVPVTVCVQGAGGIQGGHGVPHIAMKLTADSGGGSTIACAGGTIFTDANGTAVCNPVFGGKAGKITNFTVYVGGLPNPTYRFQVVTGPPAALKIITGDHQSGVPGQQLNAPLVAEVDDAGGNPLQGIGVTFAPVVAGTVTLSNSTPTSDINGKVSTRVTLGNVAGTIQVKVQTTNGAVFSLFTLNVNIVIAGMKSISGDLQSGIVVNNQFLEPIVVEVVDTHGNGVQSVPVSFAVQSGSATFGSPSAITGADGKASTTVTAGATPGPIVITASATGINGVTFHLTSKLPGPNCKQGATFYNGVGAQANFISPGGIATIVCTGLAPGLQGAVFGPYGEPLPYQLANVTVTFGSSPAPIYNVSNVDGFETVTVQVPFEVAPGAVDVIIAVESGSTTATALISEAAPGIFEWTMPDGKKRAVMLRPDGTLVTTTNPAQPGDIVRAFVTGMVPPAGMATGQYSPLGSDIVIDTPVIVGVNNGGVRVVQVSYARNLIGVWEVQFEVPAKAAAGNDAPFAVVVVAPDQSVKFSQGSSMPIL